MDRKMTQSNFMNDFDSIEFKLNLSVEFELKMKDVVGFNFE